MTEAHCPKSETVFHPFKDAAELPPPAGLGVPVDDEKCFQLWRKYHMLENIRNHSLMVARIAQDLAQRAFALGIDIDVAAVRASALLHDIAKTWSISHECSHAAVGASWVVMDTMNYAIAQGVLLHVQWPWPLPEGAAICKLPIIVYYADKRVRHDNCVSLKERFEDLLQRYGKTDAARNGIRASYEQARSVEAALAAELQINLTDMMWTSEDRG